MLRKVSVAGPGSGGDGALPAHRFWAVGRAGGERPLRSRPRGLSAAGRRVAAFPGADQPGLPPRFPACTLPGALQAGP